MSKAYVGDIGTIIQVETFVDLTSATTKEFLIQKPDGTTDVWTADIPDGVSATEGFLSYTTVDGDFDQAGTYKLQAHIETASTDHKGDTVTFEVYDAFQ